MQAQQGYSYSAQPHAAPMKSAKKKYREDEMVDEPVSNNIMYDARVIRGNTYSAKPMSNSLKQELAVTKKAQRTVHPGTRKRVGTPPPVNGRSHMTMQTDDFLEEITDRPIEQDVETQTLPFNDRPASPLFVRAKIGFDVETQIESGDLFDFDVEVEPLLEVLVGKTIHVAMLELCQEEELEAIRLQQEEFETIRNIELAEVQRLEADINRKAQEKERRIAQEKKRLEERRRLEETIAARAFSNQFLGELHINVFDMLENEGYFYEPIRKEVEENFMGDLLKGVLSGASAYDVASQMAAELMENARVKAKLFEAKAIGLREELKARLAREEADRLAKIEAERLAAIAAAKAAEEAENAPPAEE